MDLTAMLWLCSPLTALLCFVLRVQSLLPRPWRAICKKRGRHRYSVITAVYNAERWLPTYFTSLLCQTVDVERCLEIICVDDGSTDASAAVIRRWQERYPGLITYIHKENGGPASARNLGIEAATGEWLTFIDADDFVHPGYFAAVEAFLKVPASKPLGLIVCRYLMFTQRTGTYADIHPMGHRFRHGVLRIPANNSGGFTQVVVNSAFFLRRVVMEERIWQKHDVRPTFEDGEMLMHYVPAIAARGLDIGVLPQARYYHRRYDDASSLTGQAYQSFAYFDAPLALGCLRCLQELRQATGHIPLFAQMNALYALSRYATRVLDANSVFHRLPDEAKLQFFTRVREIMAFISAECLETAYFPMAPRAFIPTMLSLYKNRLPPRLQVYIERYDERSRILHVFFHSLPPMGEMHFFQDNQQLPPSRAETVMLPLWDQHERFEYHRSLPLAHESGTLHCTDDAAEFYLASTCEALGIRVPVGNVLARLGCADLSSLPRHDALRVRFATIPPLRKRYGRAWLFMDDGTEAISNAAILYRHVLHRHPEQQTFFILRKNSAYWTQLSREGFRLIPFASLRHQILLLNCERLVVSRYDKVSLTVLPSEITRCLQIMLGREGLGEGRGDSAVGQSSLVFRRAGEVGIFTHKPLAYCLDRDASAWDSDSCEQIFEAMVAL